MVLPFEVNPRNLIVLFMMSPYKKSEAASGGRREARTCRRDRECLIIVNLESEEPERDVDSDDDRFELQRNNIEREINRGDKSDNRAENLAGALLCTAHFPKHFNEFHNKYSLQ